MPGCWVRVSRPSRTRPRLLGGDPRTVVVTGATGQLGSAVVRRLLELVPADEVIASVRDRSKAQDVGVQVREGDFDRPDTLV